LLCVADVFFLACVEGPFCFTKVLLVAVTTRYAVYRALKKTIYRIFFY